MPGGDQMSTCNVNDPGTTVEIICLHGFFIIPIFEAHFHAGFAMIIMHTWYGCIAIVADMSRGKPYN